MSVAYARPRGREATAITELARVRRIADIEYERRQIMPESPQHPSEQPTDKARAGAKSLLTRGQHSWLGLSLFLTAVLLANTLYLLSNRVASFLPGGAGERFAEGTYTISKLFQVMVLSHTGLGFAVALLFLVFAVWHLPKVWRRHRSATVVTGVLFLVTGLALAITGPFIMYAAASRQHAWVWWLHVAAGAAVPATYIVHRSVSFVRPVIGAYSKFGGVLVGCFALIVAGHAIGGRASQLTAEADQAKAKGTYSGPGSSARNLADYVDGPFVPEGFVPPGSPFFPSATTTTTGDYLPSRIITRDELPSAESLTADLDTIGFVVGKTIGAESCDQCHPDSVEQWSKSAHRFASFNNPFYEATINDMRKGALSLTKGVAAHIEAFPQWKGRTGEIKSKWCSGCHDPALMLAGQMTEPIDRRTVQAQAGLTCLACHAIDKIHNNTGNGNYNIADEQEDPYLFADAAPGSVLAGLHDVAIRSKPEVHKRQLIKPFFSTSEYCATCHKVSIQEPVNDYRWLRAQNEYDNWHNSGVALNAARTFYLPSMKRQCQDCHMPFEAAPLGDLAADNGMIRSHRFLAVNTALPFIRGDTETIERIEDFLRAEKLRIDVFALRRGDDADHETIMALDKTSPTLAPGESVSFDVVVRNVGVGHTFPGGTNDSNEGWIEFTVLDDRENVIAQSGFLREDRHVDPSAHFFRAVLVDRHGEAIHRRNAPDIYTTVYANVIGPGTAHAVHYRVDVPSTPGRSLKIRARLLWRKFDRTYTEFAFNANREGFKAFEKCPDLPITEICSAEVMLPISVEEKSKPQHDPTELAADWIRFNDYGIGLLLQSDTKGAESAFAQVASLAPELVDGPRNLARVALRDGRLDRAYELLLQCESLESNDPQTAWFWGVLLQEEGRYVEAVSAYRRVLQEFPDDRTTWRNLGRTYYLDGKFREALEAMEQVLRIDPENRVAHYHAMLCARALGEQQRATAAEAAYRLYKIDESATEVTQAYRLAHPHDNLEAQPIHVHELTLQHDAKVAESQTRTPVSSGHPSGR